MQETTAPVFLVCTANRTRGLPSELLRKGRLDEVWSVATPTAAERREIFEIHLRKRRQDPSQIEGLDIAVDRSEGYVPAELEAAVKEALVEAYTGEVPVTGQLIAEQLANMVPLSEAFAEQFQEMEQWAKNNARPASGISERRPVRQRQRQTISAPTGKRGVTLN